MYAKFLLLSTLVSSAVSVDLRGTTSCESTTSESACVANSEECAWCVAAATGAGCYKASDAQGLPSSVFECTYSASYAALAKKPVAASGSCEASTSSSACASNSEGCAWCVSAATGEGCYKESDAASLPSSIFECTYSASYTLLAKQLSRSGSSCEGSSSHDACVSGSSCAWCSSGAVGSACYEAVDAQSLPSSVFECEYSSTYKDLGAKGSTCDAATSESACMAATENGEKCAYCVSAAAGANCFKESDAKGLPSSVFECEYASGYNAGLAAAKKPVGTGSSCEWISSESSCLSNSEACAWCVSAATGEACYKEADAASLPASIFECSYSSTYEGLAKKPPATAASCESTSSESACVANSEGCAWCVAAATGEGCYKASDATSLPSSVFECTFASTYKDLGVKGSTCDSAASESACLATMEGDEQCVYCVSAAAGANCFKESDAASLPSSVFECEYASGYKQLYNQFMKMASGLYYSLIKK